MKLTEVSMDKKILTVIIEEDGKIRTKDGHHIAYLCDGVYNTLESEPGGSVGYEAAESRQVEFLVMRFGGLEYILCAAVHYDDGIERVHQPKNIKTGIVVCGRRHHNCLMTMREFAYDRDHTKVKQGFLTNQDRFVTRKEAAQLAYKCGQISKEQKTLFSEDLW